MKQPSDRAVECREISYRSAEWESAVQLREEVLRTPLSLRFSEEQLATEGPPQRHISAFCGAETVGTALLVPMLDGSGRIRQVAVHADWQGSGVGKALMACAEKLAREIGCRETVLHARLVVLPFYEALGYQAEGEIFEEIGIPHRFMRKALR